MKWIFLLALISSASLAQLEKPLVEGICKRQKTSISFSLSSDALKVSMNNRNCTLDIVNSSSSNRRPIEKETLYFVPSSCDGRNVGEAGFKQGQLIDRGYLVISQTGNIYQGIFSILSTEDPFSCELKIRSWKKLEILSAEKKKKY